MHRQHGIGAGTIFIVPGRSPKQQAQIQKIQQGKNGIQSRGVPGSSGTKYYSNDPQPLLTLGYQIDNIGDPLGTGSYARVKKCIRTSDDMIFAVKIIDRKAAVADFVQKFLPRELDIIRTLDHPNIVKTHDIYESSNLTYIVMEYAQGGDLLDYINKMGRLKEHVAKRMFGELCEAIQYIHSRDICHRDLKCENLLLDKYERIKLADFGFSRFCYDKYHKKTLSRTFCGSAAYAAPEILRGQEYNPKLYDIWSMGCILYIMIYGTMPYDDSDIKKMVQAQQQGIRFDKDDKNRLGELNKYVEVNGLISAMLQIDVTIRLNIELVRRHSWLVKVVGQPYVDENAEKKEKSNYQQSQSQQTNRTPFKLRNYYEQQAVV
ncbi:unnamed protein product [Didymodactylos carnosus]|uniref:Protein kinase domain-containing protein n=1 Tax=Didymodactylos carnosus TaxID=1234261 RepID=A0A8S2EG19_9BILA|nr:unnamed protein product [Didymodactylos carnosus]CAF3922484.1 unnamed protein product [Didymodactylos carnosus]